MLPGVGGAELIAIAIVALVVVGPKDLPRMMRMIAKAVGRAQAMANDFRSSFEDLARQSELEDLRREVQSMRGSMEAQLAEPQQPAVDSHTATDVQEPPPEPGDASDASNSDESEHEDRALQPEPSLDIEPAAERPGEPSGPIDGPAGRQAQNTPSASPAKAAGAPPASPPTFIDLDGGILH